MGQWRWPALDVDEGQAEQQARFVSTFERQRRSRGRAVTK